jgi:hypothetical protein
MAVMKEIWVVESKAPNSKGWDHSMTCDSKRQAEVACKNWGGEDGDGQEYRKVRFLREEG